MTSVVDPHPARRPITGAIVISILLASLLTTSAASDSRPSPPPQAHDSTAAPQAGPVLDVPAPFLWDRQAHQRVGSMAYRFALDDLSAAKGLSAWYYLAYIVGGDRLRVYDPTLPRIQGPYSGIAKSQNVAWHVATSVLGRTSGIAQPDAIPAWALARTANIDGPSAGLIFTLARLDVLTPGRLGGHLRIAGTGAIGSDGVVTAVRMVNARLAAARLADPDVFFAPDIPDGSDPIAVVVSHQGDPSPHRTIGDWLNTTGYERAGRDAAAEPRTLKLVEVSDVRQALAWLCGRTQQPDTCTLAHTAGAVSLRTARPYSTSSPPRVAAPVDRVDGAQ